MTTRVASPSDRFIGQSTRTVGQEGRNQDVSLAESTQPGFSLPATAVQSIVLPPNVDTETRNVARQQQRQQQQQQTSITMAASSSPVYLPSTPPHRRRTSRTAWQPQRLNSTGSNSNFAIWDNHNTNTDALIADPLQASAANEINDPYLSALVDTEFSSPSSYPSFTIPSASNQSSNSRYQQPLQASAPRPGTAPYPRSTAPLRNHASGGFGAFDASACNRNLNFSAPERSETQLTTSTTTALESQNTLFTNDTQDFDELFDTPASSFDENMPVTRSGRRLEVATPPPPTDTTHRTKRRRTSTNAPASTLRKSASSRTRTVEIKDLDDDDIFVDKKPLRSTPGKEQGSEDLTTIDLTEANEVPEELRKPEKDNRTKLAAFQCVICMDDASTLTVTHCGHMYCAQCLHSSLHVEATRGKCPMCRQKLDMKARELYNGKTKGYWPLELKLMTATKKGKRKANTTL